MGRRVLDRLGNVSWRHLIVDLGVPRSSRGGGTNLFKSLRYVAPFRFPEIAMGERSRAFGPPPRVLSH